MFMIVTLLRSSQIVRKNSSEPKNSDGKIISCVYQQKKKKKSHHLSKHVKATRAILLIIGIFIVCEAPIFFAVVLEKHISPEAKLTIYKALRFLIVTDTYANFIIYLLTSKHFRYGLKKVFTCKRDDYLLRPIERGIVTPKSIMTPQSPVIGKKGLILNTTSTGDNGSAI
nr:hypothetical protein HmN_000732400 [Hymenolepis microstoma]